MRAIDRWAINEQGVPSLELMEHAGIGVARAVEELAPDGPVAVLCGKGNNGGDGLVAARLLREAGREVEVLIAGSPQELQGDARENLLRLPGLPPARWASRVPASPRSWSSTRCSAPASPASPAGRWRRRSRR